MLRRRAGYLISLGLSRCNMWDFCDQIPRERAERLHAYDSFAAVIALIAKDAAITAFAWEPFDAERLSGCNRASFLLTVPEQAYDAFFNAPAGYRGQYARSREAGEVANRSLLSNLESLLLANPSPQQSAHGSRVLRSLRATDAKCWIFEPEVEQHMGVDLPEILYSPWQNASEDGAGLRAPVGSHIEVKGGWLDARGIERRDPKKSLRSYS
jgi:hypothetical protein